MTQTKAELLQTRHQGDIRLGDADSTNYVGFKAPATVGSNLVWTLPATDGSANQFLQTNASGVLSWGTADTSASMPKTGGIFTGDVTFDGATAGRDIVFDRSDNALEFADNAKAIFGSSTDLSIYHDASNSYIKEAGTGQLHIQADNLILENAAGANYFVGISGGETIIYHNDSAKLTTASTGVSITGALTVSTNATITGNLTVSGTTTTINTQTLDVEDKNVVIGKVSSPSDTTADGGGWTLKGATDKTFNWVNANDAWTSSEHIHLGDNKKLLVGTGKDLEIFFDGTNSYIREPFAQAGQLILQGWNGTDIRQGSTGEHMIRAIGGGAVEVYHNNVKKLETTSGGINVTGAINVNGAALSTSPSITANADGAIGAGDAVIMQANGTVKKVTATTSVSSPPVLTVAGSAVPGQSSTAGRNPKPCFWPDESAFVVIYKSGSNNYLNVSAGKVTDGTDITWNAAGGSTLWSGNQNDDRIIHAESDDFIYALRDNGNTVQMGVLTATRNSDTNYSFNNQGYETMFSTGANISIEKVDTNSDYYLCVCRDYANSSRGAARMVYKSGTTLTRGSQQFGTNSFSKQSGGQAHAPFIIYDTNAGKVVAIYDGYSGGGGGNNVQSEYYNVGTPSYSTSDPTITWSSSSSNVRGTDNTNISANRLSGYFDSTNNRIVVVGVNAADSYKGFAIAGTLSGTTISWGAKSYFTSGTASYLSAVYDSEHDCGLIYYEDSGDSNKVKAIGVTLNTSNNALTFTNSLEVGGNSAIEGNRNAFFDTTNKIVLVGLSDSSNNDNAKVSGISVASTSTTADKFIGFNQGAVSNGNAATIDIVSATNENQSSLTVGSKYYVQKNGTIATTADSPSVEAGIAVAATKLVVKG
jgi:hypothetical protein